ncbi:hypothetical protein AAIG11_03560 [Anoxynatronum sibiricum]|uniref:Uncharacterized protein n=1 Tax=Anoxynatronum sibiricum TaxID=210623 RepID=A0ABU9VQZ1_9CLOT
MSLFKSVHIPRRHHLDKAEKPDEKRSQKSWLMKSGELAPHWRLGCRHGYARFRFKDDVNH